MFALDEIFLSKYINHSVSFLNNTGQKQHIDGEQFMEAFERVYFISALDA